VQYRLLLAPIYLIYDITYSVLHLGYFRNEMESENVSDASGH